MLGTRALPDVCPGIVRRFDRVRLRSLEVLVLVVSLTREVSLLAKESPCTTGSGVETTRPLGRPPPLPLLERLLLQRPLGLSPPPLLVLDWSALAEICCAEDDSSTMPRACPSVGVACTGSVAFIEGKPKMPICCAEDDSSTMPRACPSVGVLPWRRLGVRLRGVNW